MNNIETNKISPFILVFSFTILGAFLRLYNIGGPYPNGDYGELPPIIIESLPFAWDWGGITRLGKLFASGHDVLNTLILFVYSNIINFFHITINEISWKIPLSLNGILTIPLSYLFLKKFSGIKAGIIASAFISICPLHVLLSRDYEAANTTSIILLILIINYFLTYLHNKQRNDAWLTGICLSLYMFNSNLFSAIFILFPMIIYLYQKGNFKIFNLTQFLKYLFNFRIIFLPIISFTILLVVYHFSLFGGPLANFLSKPKVLGLYFYDIFPKTLYGTGYSYIFFLLSGLIFFFFSFKKTLCQKIFILWALLYYLPFCFLVPPGSTMSQYYLIYSIVPFVFFASSVIGHWINGKIGRLLIIILIFSFSITLYKKTLPILRGNHDIGIKAAGYLIREINKETPIDLVKSGAYGGGGIVPNIGMYYFGASIAGKTGLTFEQSFIIPPKSIDKIQLAVIPPESEQIFESLYGKWFQKISEITSGLKTLQLIYSQRSLNLSGKTPEKFDIIEGNKLFDLKYGHLENLMISPIDFKETCKLLDISEKKLNDLIQCGLPSYNTNKGWLFSKFEVLQWCWVIGNQK